MPFEIPRGFLKDFDYEDPTEKKTFRYHGCLREDIVLVEIVSKVKSLCLVRIVVQQKMNNHVTSKNEWAY